jgi:uncharacterized protein (TIGR02147 family)
MPDIFRYHDYRKYLADYYEEKKASGPAFSYQNFSRKAGFSSKSFVFNVIRGKKTLSRASVVRLCCAMNLTRTEAAYFENLVYFNQAVNFTERNFYFEKLNTVRPLTVEASKARELHHDQYEFYSQWFHSVIRSLIDLFPSIKDPAILAKMVSPPISAKQAKKSIALLLRLKLIDKRPNGTYAISSKILSTGRELQGLAIQRFHLACMELAVKALRELPGDKRNISGLTLGMSRKAYEKICGEIYSFQDKILAIAENDKDSDGVYQLNFHLFPVSKLPKSPRVRKAETP